MRFIILLSCAGMALTADGFDPIRTIQEREARARRDAEKSKAAVYLAPAKDETKRAEWLAALDKQIKEVNRDGISASSEGK